MTRDRPEEADTPAWFDEHLIDAAELRAVSVGGAQIRYRVGGSPSGPVILFVHGARANAYWWGPTLSLLADQPIRWVAMDLSGHGDSDRRESYAVERWADEILAVARAQFTPPGVTVVAHSLGAIAAFRAAARRTSELRGVVAVDGVPQPRSSPTLPSGLPVWFNTQAEGAIDFAARDARRRWPVWLALNIGAHSVHPDAGGWTWSHDPRTRHAQHLPLTEYEGIAVLDSSRLGLITGDQSFAADAIDSSIFLSEAGRRITRVRLPVAGHDVMMEQPVQFTQALQGLLSGQGLEVQSY